MSRLTYLREALGFDRTTHVPFTRQYRVLCGSCDSLVINGIPTHERGCPNTTHECHGCDARIPFNQRYCEDCQ